MPTNGSQADCALGSDLPALSLGGKRSDKFETENRADSLHVAGIPSDEHDTGFAATESDKHVEDEAPRHAGEIEGTFRPKPGKRQPKRIPRRHRRSQDAPTPEKWCQDLLVQLLPVAGRSSAGPELGCHNRAEIEPRGFPGDKRFEGGVSDRLSGGVDVTVGVQGVLPHRPAPIESDRS